MELKNRPLHTYHSFRGRSWRSHRCKHYTLALDAPSIGTVKNVSEMQNAKRLEKETSLMAQLEFFGAFWMSHLSALSVRPLILIFGRRRRYYYRNILRARIFVVALNCIARVNVASPKTMLELEGFNCYASLIANCAIWARFAFPYEVCVGRIISVVAFAAYTGVCRRCRKRGQC